MLTKLFQRKIHIDFVDADTNRIFSKTKMPIEQLPKSFAPATIMHLGESEWSVISANPMTIEETKKTKHLRLLLRKVKHVNAQNILYSLPTLSNEALYPTDINYHDKQQIELNSIIHIHPDSWRQIELIPKAKITLIKSEFEKINSIYNEEKLNNGFKNIYLRVPLTEPIVNLHLTKNILERYFKIKSKKLIAFPEPGHVISNGFYYELSEINGLYGDIDNNNEIKFIGIKNNFEVNDDEIKSWLIKFCDDYDLLVIDWIRMTVIN